MKKEQPTFWVTNQSNRNVSLTDLNLTIKAFSSVNLLDKKHYSYTLEQLQLSEQRGSIFNKKYWIKVRKVEPEVIKMNVPFSSETFIPSRERSVLVIEHKNYEELNVSDEEFAEDNVELNEMDVRPLVSSSKKL
jgi:hypothetical protein